MASVDADGVRSKCRCSCGAACHQRACQSAKDLGKGPIAHRDASQVEENLFSVTRIATKKMSQMYDRNFTNQMDDRAHLLFHKTFTRKISQYGNHSDQVQPYSIRIGFAGGDANSRRAPIDFSGRWNR